MQLMSWPDGERYLFPLQSLVVTFLLSMVSTLLFFRTRGISSHQNSSTRRFPRFPLSNFCFYVMLAVISLAFAATDTAFYKASIFLGLAESRILTAALADTSHLILHCPATDSLCRSLFSKFLSLYDLFPRPWAVPDFWGSMVFHHQPISRKGSGNNNNSKTEIADALLRYKGS